ncbi:hypothetical protein [Actinomyces provencensis]|uniref:hypothetical protein n=1 Tax=Actinomyces provencensis TaxID=1720198 RepID=UPI0011777946|nr:hypothetical protein [Actinomyces provencensis]
MSPVAARVPARPLDDPRVRWLLAGASVVVLDVVRAAAWGPVLHARLGWWTVVVWVASTVLLLGVALLVSPLGCVEVRRGVVWLGVAVLLDVVWRMVLVPMGLVWVLPYLGPAVAGLLVCAWLSARRSPVPAYLGAVVTALLVLVLLPWMDGVHPLDLAVLAQRRLLALGLVDVVLLLAVAAGCLVGVGIGRVGREKRARVT